jgi:hypothetical protein
VGACRRQRQRIPTMITLVSINAMTLASRLPRVEVFHVS